MNYLKTNYDMYRLLLDEYVLFINIGYMLAVNFHINKSCECLMFDLRIILHKCVNYVKRILHCTLFTMIRQHSSFPSSNREIT